MSPEDRLEDRISYLKLQVKQLEDEIKEIRQTMNALAHAVALLQQNKKTTPLWVHEYYRKWENKQKGWFDL